MQHHLVVVIMIIMHHLVKVIIMIIMTGVKRDNSGFSCSYRKVSQSAVAASTFFTRKR